MEPLHDEKIWRIARKRASFKKNLFSYLVVISFLWLVWWMTTGRFTGYHSYPWPVWVMLGWGIALGLQYFEAYNGSRQDLAEEEYKRLKEEQGE